MPVSGPTSSHTHTLFSRLTFVTCSICERVIVSDGLSVGGGKKKLYMELSVCHFWCLENRNEQNTAYKDFLQPCSFLPVSLCIAFLRLQCVCARVRMCVNMIAVVKGKEKHVELHCERSKCLL